MRVGWEVGLSATPNRIVALPPEITAMASCVVEW
ncbi:hypothetical protein A1F94_008402 [Pyrenophora tritici-repentis]|nr:hypothetical protein A1F94_008402 [Pyrenophora tritici-repentis]KAI0621944.1 hypothetical protein TUN199_06067 [Pyrenophora tritici-repentis]